MRIFSSSCLDPVIISGDVMLTERWFIRGWARLIIILAALGYSTSKVNHVWLWVTFTSTDGGLDYNSLSKQILFSLDHFVPLLYIASLVCMIAGDFFRNAYIFRKASLLDMYISDDVGNFFSSVERETKTLAILVMGRPSASASWDLSTRALIYF